MASSRISVNVGDGFLRHFTPGFLDRYGPDSEFVRAVSDHLTLNLASIMDRAGHLENPDDVARFSDDESVEVVRALIRKVEVVKQLAFKEALGTVPLGSIGQAVDAASGSAAFEKWLSAFQAKDHKRCAEIIDSWGAA